MSSTKNLYGIRSNGQHHGDVFTSPDVVRFMLDTIGYTSDKNLSKFLILEPSFGSGDFLFEILKRMIASSHVYDFNPHTAFQKCVYACEIDKNKFDSCITELQSIMPGYEPINLKNEDFLLSNWPVQFDFIIGNPPYVRYENIPATTRDIYKAKFSTFHYRCDLYVLFYEHSLEFLSNGGMHCFICSNRWLKNKYGKKLRAKIIKSYNLERLIDVENLDAFQESVLAYPAISVISNSTNDYIVKIARIDNFVDLHNEITYVNRQYHRDLDAVFSDTASSMLPTIEEQEFHVGIGVATGADKIFIASDLPQKIEPEIILPIINAKDLSGNQFVWNDRYLLNPYDKNGNTIDLKKYPKAKSYLEEHQETLRKRHIVKTNRCWYSLIDKIKPNLISQPKILLPDISANRYIFVDDGKYYPSHNIYYITSDINSIELLRVLAAILMSDFVRQQICNLSNKMNGGMPRWQSQAIKKLRIPLISSIQPALKQQLLSYYDNFNINGINEIVSILLKQPSSMSILQNTTSRQLSLFDTSFNRVV